MLKVLTVISAICLFSCFGYAQAVEISISNPLEKPEVSLKNGELHIAPAADRILVLSYQYNLDPLIAMPLKLKTTNCTADIPQIRCTMNSYVRQYSILPIWKNNPDSSRIGKVAKAFSSDVSSVSVIVDWSNRFVQAQGTKPINLGAQEPNINIQCDSYDWLPQGLNEITEVTLETMEVSEETGLTENRTIKEYRNVKLNRTAQGIEWTSARPENIQGSKQSLARFQAIVAPLMGWTFTKNGQTCDYYFERTLPSNIVEQLDKRSELKPLPVTDLSLLQKQLEKLKFDFQGAFGKRELEARKDAEVHLKILSDLGLASTFRTTNLNNEITKIEFTYRGLE